MLLKARKVFYLLWLSLVILVSGCIGDSDLPGERVDIYRDPMAKFVNKGSKNIILGTEKQIVDILQMDNGPSHRSYNATYSGETKRIWEVKLPKKGNISPPIFTKNNIFILDGNSNLVIYDLIGNLKWMKNLAPKTEAFQYQQYSGGLAIHQNKIFVLTAYGEVMALEIYDGSEIWRRRFDAPFRGGPTIFGNKIYAVASNDFALAMNLKGDTLWTLQGPTRPTLVAKAIAAAADRNRIYLPFSSGILQAVRKSDGAEIWNQTFDTALEGHAQSIIGDFGGSPILKSGNIYVCSVSGQLLAIRARNGKLLWSLPVGCKSTPTIIGGSIFIVSASGHLVRINEVSGKVIWSRIIKSTKKGKYSFFGPTLAGGSLWITGTDGNLRKFDPISGRQVELHNLKSGALYRPFAAHEKLYVITKPGRIIAFE